MAMLFLKIKAFLFSVLIVFVSVFTTGIHLEGTKDPVAADTVRIMSFNIRYAEFFGRIGMVPEQIGEYMPDSVGLQECTYDWYVAFKTLLPQYTFVGVGRDTGDISEECGEMSAILFRSDKYKLVDSGTFWLSETPEEVSFGWDAACRRICTWAVLENLETGEQYAHINTHFDHAGDLARQKSIELVSQKALSFDIPAVLTGDFNFSKGSELYSSVASTGLKDTQDLAADTMIGRTYHDYEGGEDGLPIDYIWVNEKVESVSKYRIIRDKKLGQYVSDHFPIYADMRF